MVGLLALWMGAAGRFAPAGNYGAFAMPIDALVNPAIPSYSTMIPAIAQHPGRGFEGFQYLGVGLFLTIVAAIVAAVGYPVSPDERAVHRRLLWLIPAFVVLTALAITNYPEFAGRSLPRFPLPAALAPLLDTLRASGRLFWPVAYTLVLIAILAVYRLGAVRAGQLLAVFAAVQTIDLANMAVAIRATSAAAATHRLYERTRDPRWTSAITAARDVALEPGDPTRDLALFQEIAWRAVTLGRPVRTVYAARIPTESARRLAVEHAAFLRGDLDPVRLYVLLPGSPVPAGATPRLRVLDGVRVLVPLTPSSPRSAS